MWRVPANTFSPSREFVLDALWRAAKSFAHLAFGLFYVAAFVVAIILSLSAIVAGEALELAPPLQAWVDAFVLLGVACYFLESWLRGHNQKVVEDLIASVRGRISAMEDSLPAKVTRIVQAMKHRGELG